VAYRIIFTQNAIDDFDVLDARWQATIRDTVRIHLTYEPTRESKSRIKKLRELKHPQFRLRIEKMRVFYDVVEKDVVIVAIMSKEKTIRWLEERGEK